MITLLNCKAPKRKYTQQLNPLNFTRLNIKLKNADHSVFGRSFPGAESHLDRSQDAGEAVPKLDQFGDGLFENRGEAQELKRVASGRGVEDDDVVRHVAHLTHELSERDCLVDPGDSGQKVTEESSALGVWIVRQ